MNHLSLGLLFTIIGALVIWLANKLSFFRFKELPSESISLRFSPSLSFRIPCDLFCNGALKYATDGTQTPALLTCLSPFVYKLSFKPLPLY